MPSIAELFIKEAIKTESCNFTEIAERLSDKRTIRLLHAGMGLSTEANEFLDALKKWIFYGKELDIVNLAEEIGDTFWYSAIACDELGKSFEEIQIAVIQKLRKRYANEFSPFDALNRDLSSERNELEKKIDLATGFGMGAKKLTEAIKMEIEDDEIDESNMIHAFHSWNHDNIRSENDAIALCGVETNITKTTDPIGKNASIINCPECKRIL